jgi:hypothetical protein
MAGAAARRRARAAVLWGAALFVGGQVVLSAGMDLWWPVLRDRELGQKLGCLRRRHAEAPSRPLAVVLGSSRTAFGFRPDDLGAGGSGPDVVPCNFGLLGAGPLRELLGLRRLLGAGARPDVLFVEVWPPLLAEEMGDKEAAQIDRARYSWADLRLLRRYAGGPDFYTDWLRAHLLPAFSNRYTFLQDLGAAAWLPPPMDAHVTWFAVTPSGWTADLRPITDEDRPRWQVGYRAQFGACMAHWHLSPASDRALRGLLALARRHGIPTALLVMPEDSAFRQTYSPESRAASDAYLRRLSAEAAVPLIDARTWAPDDAFTDGIHLSAVGAALFTHCFHEVAEPLLEQQPACP